MYVYQRSVCGKMGQRSLRRWFRGKDMARKVPMHPCCVCVCVYVVDALFVIGALTSLCQTTRPVRSSAQQAWRTAHPPASCIT